MKQLNEVARMQQLAGINEIKVNKHTLPTELRAHIEGVNEDVFYFIWDYEPKDWSIFVNKMRDDIEYRNNQFHVDTNREYIDSGNVEIEEF
jgi:hypothetical protein